MSEHDQEREISRWLESIDAVDYYEILGVDPDASVTSIQAAFHRFSESFHPDRHRDKSPELRQAFTKIYRRGSEAYGALRSQVSRASYDLGLTQGILRLASVSGAASAQVAAGLGLESTCTSPAGRLHARQIERALAEGKRQEAQDIADKLRLAEGHNPEFEGRLARMWGRKLL